jgi:hypothetical protein
VILVAESANFGEGYITRYDRLGGVADELACRLESACVNASLPARLRTSNLGYFLRCAEPTAFDRSYGMKLGLGSARFILDPAHAGQMVTIKEDHLLGVPMESVAGQVKHVDRTGVRYSALHALQRYESARLSLEGRRHVLEGAPQTLEWLDCHASMETVEQLAMRLGLPASTVLAVLTGLAGLKQTGDQIAHAVENCPMPSPTL